MPSSDFIKCQLYEQMHPFGERGNYIRAGIDIEKTAAQTAQEANLKLYMELIKLNKPHRGELVRKSKKK